MKLLIGIPAYNEEKVIAKVLGTIPKKFKGFDSTEIVVVDDGSVDETSLVVKKAGVKVFTHLLNRGLGGALKTLLSYARKTGADILVTFDADGQHDPADIGKLVKPLVEGKCDFVIGSRWIKPGKAPLSRLIINKLANYVTLILFGMWTTDSQSGLRGMNKSALEQIRIQTDGMEVSSEFFREVYIHKLNYSEVPVKSIYTKYSRSKGQRLTNAGNVFFKMLLRFFK